MSKLTKEVKVRISEELYQQLKTIAEQEQRSLSQVVRIALGEWIDERMERNEQESKQEV